MTLLIRNAKVDDKITDILIEDGIIKGFEGSADKVIDAKGKHVLPGAIDVHVHVREPGDEQKEDWSTASRAAAVGGVTTILDMPNNKVPTVDKKSLDAKRKAAAKSIVGFGLYLGITKDNIEKLDSFKNSVCGYKLYMGISTGEMKLDEEFVAKAFEEVAKTGKMLVVHAEDQRVIDECTSKNKGRDDSLVHADNRPNEAEEKAVAKVVELVRKYDTKVHIAHVSTKEGIELVRKAKGEGVEVTCEVAQHHLFLTRKDLEEKGGFARMNPPLRTEEDVKALWEGIKNGAVDMIASDHAPHTVEEKSKGDAPSGVPELDTFMPIMLDAVNDGKLNLSKLSELVSENPAVYFGIKNKGILAEGYDADLIIVDMDKEYVVDNTKLQTKCKWSPYNGKKLKGAVVTTIFNGEIIFESNQIDGIKATEVQYNEL